MSVGTFTFALGGVERGVPQSVRSPGRCPADPEHASHGAGQVQGRPTWAGAHDGQCTPEQGEPHVAPLGSPLVLAVSGTHPRTLRLGEG